jgi:hypothetical protein
MQAERTAEESALAGSVRGAGVCDVLRVELQPAQRALLVERVEVLRRSLEDEIARQAAAVAPRDEAAIEALGLARYELRLVERQHARLPVGDAERWTGLVGPSGIVSRLVQECTRSRREASRGAG